MKLRPFLTVLLAIVLVLISASAVGAVWLSKQSPLRLSETRVGGGPEAALFVSRQAPLMLSLQVNPDRLKAYRLTNVPLNERAQIQAQFDRWQRRLLGEPKLSYGDDIAPWAADEITLALMNPDVDRNADNGQQPGYLLAVEIADPDQAKASLQRFWRSKSARNQIQERFAGIELTYDPETSRRTEDESEAPALTTAIVGDRFVLFANYPKVLRQALNNVQIAELSLTADSTYQQAIEQLSDRRVGVAFLNLPQFATWLSAVRPTPGDTRLVAALQPTPEGILAKLNLLRADRAIDAAPQNAENLPPATAAPAIRSLLRNLPANSTFVLSGRDVGQTWQQLQTTDSFWTNSLRNAIDQQQQQWGIDFAALFRWMPGEYALVLSPRGEVSNPKDNALLQQFDAAFIAARSPDLETGLNLLNTLATQQELSSGTFQLGDYPVSAWTKLTPLQARNTLSLEATVQGLHAQLGEYEVFATSVEAMQQIIAASTEEPSALVQQTIARLENTESDPEPSSDRYAGYLDWTALRDRYGNQPLVQRLEQTIKPLFEGLQSVAFTANAADSEDAADRSLGALLLRFQGQ